MGLDELTTADSVFVSMKATCKKNLLQAMAGKAAKICGIDEREAFQALMEREECGSTGFGDGVAIPHAKLNSLKKMHGFFARLNAGVDFEAVDDAPVDLVYLLLVPHNADAEHLKALAKISRLMRDENKRQALRAANDSEEIHALLANTRACAS